MEPGAYDVEKAVFSGKFSKHLECPDGLTLSEQAALSDKLFAHFGVTLVPVQYKRRENRGAGPTYASHANPQDMVITYGALAGPAVVAHEVAHIVTGMGRENKKDMEDGYWHGPQWQRWYVEGVRVLLGEYHAKRLATAFAKFEEDKARNKARGAKKRGQRRSTLKSGPRVRTVVKSELTAKIRTRTMGRATLTWAHNGATVYDALAIRYTTNKGGYWMVSAYEQSTLADRGYDDYWESAARGEQPGVLFTEKRFSTKVEALEWAVAKLQEG